MQHALIKSKSSGWRILDLPRLVLILGVAAIFLPTMYDVARLTWTTEQGGHAPIILATGLWLLWRESRGIEEAAGALVVLAKAQSLKDSPLKPAIVQRVRELISASPAANQPPTAAALPSTPPPPNAAAMEYTTTAPPSAGSQAAARPALNAAPPHVTATSHTTSTHPPTGDPPPASVRPASTAQPTSSQQ